MCPSLEQIAEQRSPGQSREQALKNMKGQIVNLNGPWGDHNGQPVIVEQVDPEKGQARLLQKRQPKDFDIVRVVSVNDDVLE